MSVRNFPLTCGAAVILLLRLPWYVWFRQELRYINNEFNRTEGAIQERWKKRLLISLIPGVRYE